MANIPIKILRNITIDPEVYFDIETRNNVELPLLTRFDESSVLTEFNKINTFDDPFYIKQYNRNVGFSPFTYTTFVPVTQDPFCLSVIDPYAKQNPVSCYEINKRLVDPDTNFTMELFEIGEYDSTGINILFKRDDIPEHWLVDIIRYGSNLKWKIRKSNVEDPIDFADVSFTLSGNIIVLNIDFSNNVPGTKWNIYANELKPNFTALPDGVDNGLIKLSNILPTTTTTTTTPEPTTTTTTTTTPEPTTTTTPEPTTTTTPEPTNIVSEGLQTHAQIFVSNIEWQDATIIDNNLEIDTENVYTETFLSNIEWQDATIIDNNLEIDTENVYVNTFISNIEWQDATLIDNDVSLDEENVYTETFLSNIEWQDATLIDNDVSLDEENVYTETFISNIEWQDTEGEDIIITP